MTSRAGFETIGDNPVHRPLPGILRMAVSFRSVRIQAAPHRHRQLLRRKRFLKE